jgi:pimeloyl-ACP methyl ester carboxylesterase
MKRRQFSNPKSKWFIATWLIGAASATAGFTTSSTFAAQGCAGLADLKIDDTNLLSAAEVPASGDLPAYCRVLGYVRPAINFEIRLPLRDWNGKFYMAGCGGFCGSLGANAPGFSNAMNFGLRRNYAVSTSDSGHWGSSATDGRWALDNPVALMDFAQRSVPETARVTKIILKAFYGTEQKKSYFAGCSNGGRMAAMEALRYPKDFDGIISGAPALDGTGLIANLFGWATRANTGPDGKPVLSLAKVKLLEHAVYEACGEKNGIKDSVIADPRACHFKPAVLQCRAGNAADCLTQAEVGAAEKIYGGPVNSRGQQLYPGGVPLGSEPFWPLWVTGRGDIPGRMALFAQDFYRYLLFRPMASPDFKVMDYDFDRDPSRLGYFASIGNAATFNPDTGEIEFSNMSAFRQAGGKLIIYHGWADALVTPQLTVYFYDALAKKSGGIAATQEFARLFMVPGMDHCGAQTNGPGIADTGIDPLTALEQWVEEGKAPSELIATKTAPNSNQTLWRRPLCAYPKVARYNGGGDPTDAANFTCTEP